ncbi:hypothetical protein GCM10017673_43980 [Streptosporangium violaceochromogenes]|nr:hypothetical protein GCM10017673_43980 [Streptosporangium violaceochromogenes]
MNDDTGGGPPPPSGLSGKVALVTGIAQAVLYLASDASSWVTGVTLDLTGGRVIV